MSGCFGKKSFKKMFKGIKVNENWGKLYNKKLMQPFGKLDEFSFIRINV